MKFLMHRVLPLPVVIASLALVSCATVSKVGSGSSALVGKTTSRVSEFAQRAVDKINPPAVKVVEVREKDLKPLPTGQEQALAFENTRKRSFWSFLGPVDFKEPELPAPDVGDQDVTILLPPKTP